MAKLFKDSIIKEKLKDFEIKNFEEKIKILTSWFDLYKSKILSSKTEKEIEQSFNEDFLGKILGYSSITENEIYNREPQPKTPDGGQKADFGLGFFSPSGEKTVSVVIEVKDAKTSLDKSQQREGNLTPIQQAFKYKPYFKDCDFVIVSNFFETRLYLDSYYDFEIFDLSTLASPKDDYFEFRKFYFLLCKENLISKEQNSNTKNLLSLIKIQEKEITKKFYKEYCELRKELFKDIVSKNQIKKTDLDLVLNKTQKIIDRIIFIHFCEDLSLLPDGKLKENIFRAEEIGFSPWDVLKIFFKGVDVGSQKLGIPDGYNGGLFHNDEELNNLKIGDEICKKFVDLGDYDFANDLSVNILGHIFEQSISDLEEMREKINENIENDVGNAGPHSTEKENDVGNAGPHSTEKENDVRNADPHSLPEATSKRKKDGIFYTPEYIVDFIVKNSVGKKIDEWEDFLKKENGFDEKLPKKEYEKISIKIFEELKEKVQNIKVLDPACGSGAFLVKVFDFLLEKNKEIAKKIQDLKGENQENLFSDDLYFKNILQNNIFGVDLNEESVEITKLSLWLKTAQKGKKLQNLDQNIKCGNSLIDDEEIAGKKAFVWEKEFEFLGKENITNENIAREQNNIARGYDPLLDKGICENKFFHIIFATHNSRTSQRMVDYKVQKGEPIIFSQEEEIEITKYILEIVKEDNIKVLAYNIYKDHIHILIAGKEDEIPKIIQKIKAVSARKFNINKGITEEGLTMKMYNNGSNKGSGPLVVNPGPIVIDELPKKGIEQNHLWAQKYYSKEISDEKQLYSVINYIKNNRIKHIEQERINGKCIFEEDKEIKDIENTDITSEHIARGHDPLLDNDDLARGHDPLLNPLLEEFTKLLDPENGGIEKIFENEENNNKISQNITNKHIARGHIARGHDPLLKGGFDVIVGNPPYGAFFNDISKKYFLEKYKTAFYKLESYALFMEKSLNLLKNNGILGFIVPYTWLSIGQHKKLRELILKYNINKIVDLPCKIFESADLDTIIFIISKIENQKNNIEVYDIKGKDFVFKGELKTEEILSKDDLLINLEITKEDGNILNKFNENIIKINNICKVSQGYIPYRRSDLIINYGDELGNKIIDNRLWHSEKKESDEWKQEIQGKDISRYSYQESFQYVKYGKHLASYVNPDFFNKPRLLIMEITRGNYYKLSSVFIEKEFYNTPSIINIISNDDKFNLKYILSLLNSKLYTYYHLKNHSKALAETSIPKILVGEVRNIPIKNIPLSEQTPFIEKADFMLEQNKILQEKINKFLKRLDQNFQIEKLTGKLENFYLLSFGEFVAELGKCKGKIDNKGSGPLAKISLSLKQQDEWEEYFEEYKKEILELKQKISLCDKEIDEMVFDLYGLDEEERKVVLG